MLLPIDINIEIETNCIKDTNYESIFKRPVEDFHPIISFSSIRNYDILYDYVPLNTNEYLICFVALLSYII